MRGFQQGHTTAFRLILGVVLSGTVVPANKVDAQQRARRPRKSTSWSPEDQAGATVKISYPDSVDLSAFVDYVSQTLGIKIIYENELRSQTVVFRPGEVEVPRDQLLDLLRGMLRMRDLALVEGHVDGWLRIVPTNDMQRHIGEIRDEVVGTELRKSNRVVTQIVHVNTEDMQSVLKHARNFLSSSKASIIEVPDKKLIVITDYESAITKAIEIIKLIDVAPTTAEVVTVGVRHHDATTIAERVIQILNDKAQLEGRRELDVTIQPDLTGSGILLVGSDQDIGKATALIRRFDTPMDEHRPTVTYAPKFISADRLKILIEHVLVDEAYRKNGIRFFLDAETNRLYVTAPPEMHDKIANLLQAEDVKALEASRPMHLYRPRNRLARELISILSEVLPNISVSSVEIDPRIPSARAMNAPPGPNRPPSPAGPGQAPPIPPAQERIEAPTAASTQIKRIEGTNFVLSCDEHTNAIIAIGPREFHTKLQALLRELDERQAQVMIEMTLVAITFNDSLSLAVELANEEKFDGYQSLFFSSFGLSDIHLDSGLRSFRPGGGINGVLVGPNETPFLMRAIAAHGNSRIMATPKILLSDSTTATIGSVEEAPFTSINASDTVATTSFAGFESAGTMMTVTPHITQGDHIVLDYSFSFSNFTGSSSVGVPPPRTTNSFSGSIALPDGYTVIVGGLVTENETDSVTEVPLLGRIPVLGALFQSSDRVRTKSRVFAFIRPTILRDDRFADLKLISQTELERAELLNRDYPGSEYQWMR